MNLHVLGRAGIIICINGHNENNSIAMSMPPDPTRAHVFIRFQIVLN